MDLHAPIGHLARGVGRVNLGGGNGARRRSPARPPAPRRRNRSPTARFRSTAACRRTCAARLGTSRSLCRTAAAFWHTRPRLPESIACRPACRRTRPACATCIERCERRCAPRRRRPARLGRVPSRPRTSRRTACAFDRAPRSAVILMPAAFAGTASSVRLLGTARHANDHVRHAGVGDERLAAGELETVAGRRRLAAARRPDPNSHRARAARLPLWRRRWPAAARYFDLASAAAMSVAAHTVPRKGPGKQARPISSATTARSTDAQARVRQRLRSDGCPASLDRPLPDHNSG